MGCIFEHNVKAHTMNDNSYSTSMITQLYKRALFSEYREEISRYNEISKETIYLSSDETVLIFLGGSVHVWWDI